jgi:hypothetical protein
VQLRLCICGLVAALLACADVAPPPGGPIDRTPAELSAVLPESLATKVAAREELRFEFSERVDRMSFSRALTVVPAVELEKAHFDELVVSVRPRNDWPESTAIVWTLDTALKDKHGVPLKRPLSGAFTRDAALPAGRIEGRAKAPEGKGAPAAVWAELTRLAADGRRRMRWRFAEAGADGAFALEHLRAGDGPFQLEVFQDRNGNGRREEREPTARLDSLVLPDSLLTFQLGDLTLLDLEGPVEVRVCLAADSAAVWIYGLDESDAPARLARADSLGCATLALLPGLARVGAFWDLDADGRFGPDSLGTSEPFAPLLEFDLAPAQPETLRLADAQTRVGWTTIDSLPLAPPPAVRSVSKP